MSEINGEPTDDWLTIDLVIMPPQDYYDDHDTPDPRQGGWCNNIGTHRYTIEEDGETSDHMFEFCMDSCIVSGGSIETAFHEYEFDSYTVSVCKIDQEDCAEGFWMEYEWTDEDGSLVVDGHCDYSCMLSG